MDEFKINTIRTSRFIRCFIISNDALTFAQIIGPNTTDGCVVQRLKVGRGSFFMKSHAAFSAKTLLCIDDFGQFINYFKIVQIL